MNISEQLKDMTVLFVEDEEMARVTIGRLLAPYFERVILAENGNEGLASVSRDHPHIIISDLEMPGMDGMEMIRRIRELGHEIPIIITTGYDDEEHFSGLADRTLTKPILLKNLINAVTSCLEERQPPPG